MAKTAAPPRPAPRRKAPPPEVGANGATQPAAGNIIYPDLRAVLCAGPPGESGKVGDGALTQEQISTLLGWEEEPKPGAYGSDYLFQDNRGNNIRCLNNIGNRPLDLEHCYKLAQDHLQRNWAGPTCMPGLTVNGEAVIIGQTGRVISAQHRLISAKLAEQIRTGPDANHWVYDAKSGRGWDSEVTMDTLVVFGVSEDPRIVRTVDNVRPRTIGDVLYTIGAFDGTPKQEDRAKLCKITDYAVRTLWSRTGAKDSPFSPYRTHSEVLDFLDRHPRVVEAVKHIYKEYNAKRTRPNPDPTGSEKASNYQVCCRRMSPGAAAALLYLMGASETEGHFYHNARLEGQTSEAHIDWKNWKKACTFWTRLCKGDDEFQQVWWALSGLVEDGVEGIGRINERTGILVKAWIAFSANEKMTKESLQLAYKEATDTTPKQLAEFPVIEGIDLGYDGKGERTPSTDPPEDDGDLPDADAEEPGEGDLTPDQIQERAEEQRRLREEEETKAQADKDKRKAKREELLARRSKSGNPTPPSAAPETDPTPAPPDVDPPADTPAEDSTSAPAPRPRRPRPIPRKP